MNYSRGEDFIPTNHGIINYLLLSENHEDTGSIISAFCAKVLVSAFGTRIMRRALTRVINHGARLNAYSTSLFQMIAAQAEYYARSEEHNDSDELDLDWIIAMEPTINEDDLFMRGDNVLSGRMYSIKELVRQRFADDRHRNDEIVTALRQMGLEKEELTGSSQESWV